MPDRRLSLALIEQAFSTSSGFHEKDWNTESGLFHSPFLHLVDFSRISCSVGNVTSENRFDLLPSYIVLIQIGT